jgi:nucleoside-diphosphate-sugar epimerase
MNPPLDHSPRPHALPSPDLEHVLEHTRDLWEELRGQRLFITGGTGFFGHWLLESFTHANQRLGLHAEATVLTRQPDSVAARMPHLASRKDLRFIGGDVRNFRFPDGQFTHLVHAGTTSSAPVDPLEMFDTILHGTRRVLDFAAIGGGQKLLFVSSGAVYGQQPPDLSHVPEDYAGASDPTNPSSAYGAGKRAAETLCVLHGRQHGFAAKIARCFAFVGPHLPLDAHFAIGNFIRDALRGEPIRIQGDGTPLRSYLYAADLAIWLWTILFKGQADRAYNVGSPNPITITGVAEAVRVATNRQTRILIAQPQQRMPPSRYVPTTTRCENELGLNVCIDLDAALRRTVEWLLRGNGYQERDSTT